MRIYPTKAPKEPIYQVVLDSLALSPLYTAFLITAEVLKIYMHQFWHTITKIKNSSSYKFKLDKKKCTIYVEIFRDILHICPRIPNQEFDALPSDEEIVTVIKELGHKESIFEDEDAMDKGVADKSKKRKPDDADRDEGPPVGSDQWLKKKKTSKETKPSKKAKSTGTSKGTTKSQPKSTRKSVQTEEIMFEAEDNQVPHNIGEDMDNTDEPPIVNVDPNDWFKKPERPPTPDPEWNACPAYKFLNGTWRSYVELQYTMEECYKALTDQLDWNNLEGDRYPFDLSKQLPLVQSRNRQIVLVDYFFNNDLAYLQRESTGRSYTTSLTKTKAAKYDLPGTEDMVPNLWSPIKVAYNKHALLVTNVKVNVWYGYGHLEEIENRLFNLKGEDIVYLAAALRMFTRRIVIQKRVEDLQLDPQGVIYEDKLNRKRLMHFDKLYKFSDGTLQLVRDTLHDIATNLRMGYNKAMPKRRWSHLDKTRSHIMVKDIDRQLQERRLMRFLEKFVGFSGHFS
nr:hypothetical protein [Tanacetum cinerariifolium]